MSIIKYTHYCFKELGYSKNVATPKKNKTLKVHDCGKNKSLTQIAPFYFL